MKTLEVTQSGTARSTLSLRPRCVVPAALLCSAMLVLTTGCNTVSGAKYQQTQRALQLSEERVESLEKQVVEQSIQIDHLQKQAAELRGLDAASFDELVVPIKIQFASQSTGYDTDGKVGDDGLLLHIQPVDADGHVIKVAGSLKIRLLDLSKTGDAMEIGVYAFDRPTTRSRWFGRLWTNHFSVRCPWPADHVPTTDEVTAYVEFTDLLTGKTLTTQAAFKVQIPPASSSQ